jgi:hypothetical protein
MDVFERAVAGDLADSLVSDMMSYAFRVVMSLVQSRDYRSQLLRTLVYWIAQYRPVKSSPEEIVIICKPVL